MCRFHSTPGSSIKWTVVKGPIESPNSLCISSTLLYLSLSLAYSHTWAPVTKFPTTRSTSPQLLRLPTSKRSQVSPKPLGCQLWLWYLAGVIKFLGFLKHWILPHFSHCTLPSNPSTHPTKKIIIPRRSDNSTTDSSIFLWVMTPPKIRNSRFVYPKHPIQTWHFLLKAFPKYWSSGECISIFKCSDLTFLLF